MTRNGQPMAGIRVTFIADAETGSRGPRAEVALGDLRSGQSLPSHLVQAHSLQVRR